MNSAEIPITFDFDIVERFPEEICRNVFSNLTLEELKSASLVSKDWYSLIGRTPERMKTLTLSFDRARCWTHEINELLTISTRRYENFHINIRSTERIFTSKLEDILKIRDRKWKKVFLRYLDFDFEAASDLFRDLEYIAGAVEELELNMVGIRDQSKIEISALKFPKLKVLTVHDNLSRNINFFVDCTTLKKLTISSYQYDDEENLKVRALVKRNKGLKILNIENGCGTQFLQTDISEGLQSQLTSLSIEFLSSNVGQNSNLVKLLRSQLTSLKSLRFRRWIGVEATKMIFHMPNLTRLTLDTFDCTEENIDLKIIDFRHNTAITELHFINTFVDTLRVFFPLMPNVKHLEVTRINDEILDITAANFPTLESLSTRFFDVNDVSSRDILKNLKQISTKNWIGAPFILKSPSFHFAKMVDDMNKRIMEEWNMLVRGARASIERRDQNESTIWGNQ